MNLTDAAREFLTAAAVFLTPDRVAAVTSAIDGEKLASPRVTIASVQSA